MYLSFVKSRSTVESSCGVGVAVVGLTNNVSILRGESFYGRVVPRCRGCSCSRGTIEGSIFLLP